MASWDRASLVVDEKLIRGNKNAKLCIQIESKADSPWNMQVFKAGSDPTKFVFEMSRDEMDELGQIPLRTMKSFLNQGQSSLLI